MASSKHQRQREQRYSPQVSINIIGTDPDLNRYIADHLKVAIRCIGCTAAINNSVELDDISWAPDNNFEACLEKLNKKWNKIKKKICKQKHIEDFLLNVQTVEHLSALTTVMQTVASNRQSYDHEFDEQKICKQLDRLHRREKQGVHNVNRIYDERSHMRIRLFVLKSSDQNEVDCLIEHSCKMTCSKRKVFYRDGVDRPGDIWSEIYGLIMAEQSFAPMLKKWEFNEVASHKKCANIKRWPNSYQRSRINRNYRASSASAPPPLRRFLQY